MTVGSTFIVRSYRHRHVFGKVGESPAVPGNGRALAVANRNLTDPFDLGVKSNGTTPVPVSSHMSDH